MPSHHLPPPRCSTSRSTPYAYSRWPAYLNIRVIRPDLWTFVARLKPALQQLTSHHSVWTRETSSGCFLRLMTRLCTRPPSANIPSLCSHGNPLIYSHSTCLLSEETRGDVTLTDEVKERQRERVRENERTREMTTIGILKTCRRDQ